MKRMLFGAILGAFTCAAVYSCGSQKCVKRTGRMLMNKLEDLLD